MNNIFNKAPMIWFLALSALPIIIALLFHPLWKLPAGEGSATVSLTAIALNAIIVPVYLIVVLNNFVLRHDIHLAIAIPTCIASVYGSIYIQYWNWGTATGLLNRPDAETKRIILFQVIISLIIVIGGIVMTTIKSKQA